MTTSVVPTRGTHFAVDLTPDLGLITVSGVLDTPAVDTVDECLVLATGPPDRVVVIDLTGVSSLGERAVRQLERIVGASRRCGAVIEIEATAGSAAHHALNTVSFVLRPRPQGVTASPRHPAASCHLQVVPDDDGA